MVHTIHLPLLLGCFYTQHAALESCSAKSSGRRSVPSFQYRVCAYKAVLTELSTKLRGRLREVYSEVITTVQGGDPLAEKIQKGFNKEAAV